MNPFASLSTFEVRIYLNLFVNTVEILLREHSTLL